MQNPVVQTAQLVNPDRLGKRSGNTGRARCYIYLTNILLKHHILATSVLPNTMQMFPNRFFLVKKTKMVNYVWLRMDTLEPNIGLEHHFYSSSTNQRQTM
jgi:hypothetical protein